MLHVLPGSADIEEGLKLVRSCDRKLKQFETKINDIIQKNEGDEDEL